MYFRNDQYKVRRYNIAIGSEMDRYLLLLYENKNKYRTLVNIMKFNKNFNMWQCVYCTYLPYVDVKFYNQKWNLTNAPVLVLYSPPQGSGGFISYEVIGKDENIVKKHVSEEFIFGGSIFFEDDKLIRGSGNQFKVWDKENDEYVLKPYQMPVYRGATVVKYSIVDENTVKVDKTNYKIPVGGIIQFIREDNNDVTERLLISSMPSCLEFINYGIFKFTCKTEATATIIPGGYNWEGAKEINVKVDLTITSYFIIKDKGVMI